MVRTLSGSVTVVVTSGETGKVVVTWLRQGLTER